MAGSYSICCDYAFYLTHQAPGTAFIETNTNRFKITWSVLTSTLLSSLLTRHQISLTCKIPTRRSRSGVFYSGLYRFI
uniref:Uncharacterized protein n=1 Tax=Salmonella sp. TaxID=599 RepID=A0A482ETE4_SALSP|nr:hypothetical protein NNIBIDOC_00159 [Salmonella sp.]